MAVRSNLFPFGTCRKNSLGHRANRQGHSKLKAAGLEILGYLSPTGLAHCLGHIVLGGSAFQNSHWVLTATAER